MRRALPESVQQRREFVCDACETPVSDLQARRRRERQFDWIECNVCGGRVSLAEPEYPIAKRRSQISGMDIAADAKRDLDSGLVSAAAEMQTENFRAKAVPGRGTLALVFTDIVDSTALTVELGDEAMARVRRDHFERARQLIQEHNGYEVQTIGDSLLVSFQIAAVGLDSALAFRSNSGDRRVQIRAGLHVGPVRIEERDTVGATVNYTNRVLSSALGAEVRVSERAKADIDLEKASRHRDLVWSEHPECELRGFPGKHCVWSVAAGQRQPE
jgi:class 3 adenylate cyclase